MFGVIFFLKDFFQIVVMDESNGMSLNLGEKRTQFIAAFAGKI